MKSVVTGSICRHMAAYYVHVCFTIVSMVTVGNKSCFQAVLYFCTLPYALCKMGQKDYSHVDVTFLV